MNGKKSNIFKGIPFEIILEREAQDQKKGKTPTLVSIVYSQLHHATIVIRKNMDVQTSKHMGGLENLVLHGHAGKRKALI